nr:PREDICTED: uncharacterized protein LOC106704575 [Latimeria chalumnae]|eukprot:XP_014347361.1 PREDICTED: uncharacterized protein LOC106704575 [Latimeria chalumnae]
MSLVEEHEKKAAPGFQHCANCSSPFPATDKHRSCLKCLGPDHLPRDCEMCRSMGSRATKNREQQFKELSGRRASSLSPSGSSRHRRVAESDPSDPMQRETQSASGHASSHQGTAPSKTSKKSFSKRVAPASSASVPTSRAASEPRLRHSLNAPASTKSGKASTFLDSDSESELEASSDAVASRSPDVRPRVKKGPTQSASMKSHGSDSSRSCHLSPHTGVATFAPFM